MKLIQKSKCPSRRIIRDSRICISSTVRIQPANKNVDVGRLVLWKIKRGIGLVALPKIALVTLKGMRILFPKGSPTRLQSRVGSL